MPDETCDWLQLRDALAAALEAASFPVFRDDMYNPRFEDMDTLPCLAVTFGDPFLMAEPIGDGRHDMETVVVNVSVTGTADTMADCDGNARFMRRVYDFLKPRDPETGEHCPLEFGAWVLTEVEIPVLCSFEKLEGKSGKRWFGYFRVSAARAT